MTYTDIDLAFSTGAALATVAAPKTGVIKIGSVIDLDQFNNGQDFIAEESTLWLSVCSRLARLRRLRSALFRMRMNP